MQTARQDIDTILERYPCHPQHLINLLQDVQAGYSYISPEHLTLICDHVGVPVTQAWSVATFYKSFSLELRGRTRNQGLSGHHLSSQGRATPG